MALKFKIPGNAPIMEEGEYEFVITRIKSNEKKGIINIQFTRTDDGQVLDKTYYILKDGMPNTSIMNILGWMYGAATKTEDPEIFDEDNLLGKYLIMTVSHGEWEDSKGKTHTSINLGDFKPSDGAGLEESEAEDDLLGSL